MRQYSADQVELSWNGLDFKSGLAAGTFITESLNGGGFSMTPAGAVPTVTRTLDVDKSGSVSIVVDQTSTLHQQLLIIARSDRNPATRTQVDTMKLKDTSSGETCDWVNAHIQIKSAMSRGTEAQTFTWVFNFESWTEGPTASNTTNVVGN